MWRSVVTGVIIGHGLVAACFDPSYPAGARCAPDGWCPPGQFCSTGQNLCLPTPAPACVRNPEYGERTPEGSAEGRDNGHRYRVIAEPASWSMARSICEDDDAHLAVIDDQAENAHIRALSPDDDVWIGLNDQDSEGMFVWVTGSPVQYTLWESDEPGGGRTENCVEMRHPDLWNDASCLKERHFVCECDPTYRPGR